MQEVLKIGVIAQELLNDITIRFNTFTLLRLPITPSF